MDGLFREYCDQKQGHQHNHGSQHDKDGHNQYKDTEEMANVKGSTLALDVPKATIRPLAIPSPAQLTKPSPLLLLEALTARVADEAITLER